MTTLIASDATREHYSTTLEKVMPDLHGYDEIYVIRKQDLEVSEKNCKSAFGNFLEIMGQGQLVSAMSENDPLQRVAFDKLFFPIENRRTSALIVSTPNGDDQLRAGIIILDSEQLNRSAFAGMENHVLAHEAGHLVHIMNKNLLPLHQRQPFSNDYLRESELFSDTYMQEKFPNFANSSASKSRITSGVNQIISDGADATVHLTTPFMAGEFLGHIQPKDISKVLQPLGQAIDMHIVSQMAAQLRGEPDQSSNIQACVGAAVDKRHDVREHIKTYELDIPVPTLTDTVIGCTKFLSKNRSLVENALPLLPEGSPSRQLGEVYLETQGSSQPRVTPPAGIQPKF